MPNHSRFLRGIIVFIFIAGWLAGGATAFAADSEVDRLLNLLVQKRVLTREEAESVRTEVKQEGPAPPEAAAAQAATSAPAPATSTPGASSAGSTAAPDVANVSTAARAASAPTPQAEKTLEAEARAAAPSPAQAGTNLPGHAKETLAKLPFKLSGYAQPEWTSLPGAGSTFQIRRARLIVDGNVGQLATYRFQMDALHSPTLLDANLTLNLLTHASVTLGQFKIPFSQESLRSDSQLYLIERSTVVDSLVPGRDINANGRDIGAQVSGWFNFSDTAGVDYSVGIFNGAGIDRKDDNNKKDFAGRIALRPFQGLTLAGDYYKGATGANEVSRARQGAEIAYTYHPLTLAGEFIWGHDGAVREQGWYGLGAWQFSKQWEGVFRVDNFNPNRSRPGLAATNYLGGFNWYFAPGLRWQLNFGLANKQNRTQNLFLSQFQFQF